MRTFLTIALGFLLFSCQKTAKQTTTIDNLEADTVSTIHKDKYPKDIFKVLEAHGGMQAFNQMNTLIFELANPEGAEKHSIDLKNRYSRIETDKFVIGFDGNEAWIDQDSTYFKGDPRFYHNLMFYFYAMPFVLGDDGIQYQEVTPLSFNGVAYPGYQISYEANVGDSPDDNYFIYYDPETFKMKFLGYTVTYFSKEKSTTISLIEYAEWKEEKGFLLPKTLKWRNFENDSVGEVKSERLFELIKIDNSKLDMSLFKKMNIHKDS